MPNWKKVVVSGSAANLSSLHVDTSVTASIFSGSEFIGNLSGTASQAISSSYALTASYISGSSDSAISASYALSSSYALTASYIAVLPTIVTGSNATFVQPTPANTWTFVHNLNDQYPVFQVFNASNEVIIPTSITANNTTTATITFSVPTAGTAVASIGGFTGSATALSASYAATASFAFTASYVLNAISASRATSAATASYVVTALTASYVLNAQTASYVETAQTASYVTTAQTASYVLNAVSSSTAVSSSFALTASYALNAEGSGATTGSNTFIGDQVISGSLAVTGSVAGNVILTPTTASNILVTAGFNGMLISPVQLQGSSSVAIGSNLIIL